MIAITRNSSGLFGLAALLLFATVAIAGDSFPGQASNSSQIKTQQKADKLFEKGDYERAMFIYRKELAPVGDKFAQYMVGYMHLSGRGVGEDPVAALAWYRLAAERGEKSYVRVRDHLAGLLNDEQVARAEDIYQELRADMGDVALITRLIDNDLKFLTERRGDSRLFQEDFKRLNFGRKVSNYKDITELLEERIEYLVDFVAADRSATEQERETIRRLAEDVRREINVLKASLK